MSEGIKWAIIIACTIICIAGLVLLMKGSEVGDTVHSYLYKGSTIVDDSCPIVSNLQEKFGDYIITDEGVTVTPICGTYVVKVGFYNTTDQNLGYDWLTKTPMRGWSTLMFIVLTVAFIGGFIGSAATAMLLAY